MAATAALKKSPYIEELMDQGDPAKEVSTVKKTNDCLLFLSSNKMTHYWLDDWMYRMDDCQ